MEDKIKKIKFENNEAERLYQLAISNYGLLPLELNTNYVTEKIIYAWVALQLLKQEQVDKEETKYGCFERKIKNRL